jgi:uncharacterized membrane protein YkvI
MIVKNTTWIGIGLAYVGTVVGAGFASGQEIWQFFSRHGPWGGAGILLAGSVFFFLGSAALERGHAGTTQFSQFLRESYGRFGLVLEYATTIILALGIGVVAVGGGATLSLLAGWPPGLTSLLMLAAVIMTAVLGGKTVVRVNIVIVPYLLTLTMLAALGSHPSTRSLHFSPHGWWFSATLYVSYNLFTGMMALLGMGALLPSRADAKRAALLGAVMLTGMALLEHRVLMGLGNVGDLPMLVVAEARGGFFRDLFGASLLAAMYTTGIGEAFALVARYGKLRSQWVWLSGIMIGWPFQSLVSAIYPVLGVLSVAFWAPLIVPRLNKKGSGGWRL